MKTTSLLVVLIVAQMACSQQPGENEAKSALALAKAQRERQSINVLANVDRCYEDQADAEKAAKLLGRSVVYWVGMCCTDSPEVRRQLPDVVHCHLQEMNGSSEPRVVFTTTIGEQKSLSANAVINCAPCSAATIRQLSGLKELPKK